MASQFLIRVVHKDSGDLVASWEPGLSVEKDLINELLTRTEAKGVGLGRTTSHVLTDLRAALEELLFDLKNQVRP